MEDSMDVKFSAQDMRKLFGLKKSTLRFYESEGLLAPSRSPNGYRVYSYNDFRTLFDILAFREANLPVNDIRAMLYSDDLESCRMVFDRKYEALLEEKRAVEARIQKHLSACRVFDSVDKSCGKVDLSPLPPHVILSKRYLDRSDVREVMFLVERYKREGELCILSSVFPAMAEEDAYALGIDKNVGGGVLSFSECVHSVVISDSRSLEPLAIEPLVRWANEQKITLAEELYANYLVVSAGKFYVEVFIPVTSPRL